MSPWIEISQLQKRMDDFHLGPIDLQVEPGTITALVGNNGAGKSTLLKLMMNLVKPEMGNIKLFDKFVYGQDESWKQHVAYLPQTTIGMDPFTGESLRKLISHWYPNWDERLFLEIVDLFDVPLNKRFSKLSQGSQQKLQLALTISRNTSLLLLDEPTAFIDIPSKKILMDLLVDWMDKGERAIVIASHQAEDIRKLADYLLVLKNGQMVGNFEKEALTENYRRYWMGSVLPPGKIAGEVSRESTQLLSDDPEATEQYLDKHALHWSNQSTLDLDEIISLLLQEEWKPNK